MFFLFFWEQNTEREQNKTRSTLSMYLRFNDSILNDCALKCTWDLSQVFKFFPKFHVKNVKGEKQVNIWSTCRNFGEEENIWNKTFAACCQIMFTLHTCPWARPSVFRPLSQSACLGRGGKNIYLQNKLKVCFCFIWHRLFSNFFRETSVAHNVDALIFQTLHVLCC